MRILVHSSRDGEAGRYAELVRPACGDAEIFVSTTPGEAERGIGEAEIVLGWRFPSSMFVGAKRLRWIHKVSAGVDDLVTDATIPPGVVVTRSHGALIAPRMIEYVLGAIFATVQHFPRAWRQQRERRWETFMVDRARGRTVGMAGLGDIGTAIAQALHQSGMRVIGWRRSRAESSVVERLYAGADEFLPFLRACDFVVSVLPATPQTNALFNAEAFAAMKPTAYLINVGRGNAVDEHALADAVRKGRIAGAVLDVFAEEPLPTDSPLWALDDVLITPHVSGPIVPEEVVGDFLDNLARYRRGEPLHREVDRSRGY